MSEAKKPEETMTETEALELLKYTGQSQVVTMEPPTVRRLHAFVLAQRDALLLAEQNVRELTKASEAMLVERDARFDCKGGPGTTTPACRGCVTCLHRELEQMNHRASKAEAMLVEHQLTNKLNNTPTRLPGKRVP